MTNFGLPKPNKFADNSLNLMKQTSQKFSTQVESTEGKGEIARYEQFLLLPQCFEKTCTADTWKPGLARVRVKVV